MSSAHWSPSRTSISLPDFQESLKDWMVFSSKTFQIRGVLFLSVPDRLSLSPLSPCLPSGLHCCLSLNFQRVLTLQAVIRCYPSWLIPPPFRREKSLGAGSGLREILLIVYRSCPCGFSWLLETLSFQRVTPCKTAEGWLLRVVCHSWWVLEACRENTKMWGQIHDSEYLRIWSSTSNIAGVPVLPGICLWQQQDRNTVNNIPGWKAV